MQQAEEHPNTKGCKVSADLNDLVQALTSVDADLLMYEREFKLSGVMGTEDINASAKVATKLAEGIKAGKKKASGLQSLWDA